ncbi:MAG TPA: hypothetical protein VF597_00305 [Candidatus Saccharimonadales bacterium]|jgi:hypothetical protein
MYARLRRLSTLAPLLVVLTILALVAMMTVIGTSRPHTYRVTRADSPVCLAKDNCTAFVILTTDETGKPGRFIVESSADTGDAARYQATRRAIESAVDTGQAVRITTKPFSDRTDRVDLVQ